MVEDAPITAGQAGEPTAGDEAQNRRAAPWRGRKRVADPRDKVLRIRCSATELDQMEARASEAGLSLGGLLRAAALGHSGPRAVKRPRVEKAQLARLLGEVGRLGGNVNQIARWCNTARELASLGELETMRADIAAMRVVLMEALDHGDQG